MQLRTRAAAHRRTTTPSPETRANRPAFVRLDHLESWSAAWKGRPTGIAWRMDSLRLAIVPDSVLRGVFHVVQDDDRRRALPRLQLEPELVLQRFQKSRSRRIGLQIRDSRLRGRALWRPFEGEIEVSAEPRPVDHGPLQLSHSR